MLIDLAGKPVSAKREIQIADPRLARIAANVDDTFRLMHLTVVCVDCGSGVIARNHVGDTNWRMECECTVRIMANPDRKVPAA